MFQPVVDLHTGAVVGHEALTRFDDGIGPADRLAQAAAMGAGIELEVLLARAGVAAAASLPGTAWVSLNVSPALLRAGLALSHVVAGASRPVVLELDHRAIGSDEELLELLAALPVGATLALSSIVPAYETLHLLGELGAEFGKLDAGWVRGLPGDPARQALVKALVDVAGNAGCNLVARGIETRAERECLEQLGVPLGQGFLLGRPHRLARRASLRRAARESGLIGPFPAAAPGYGSIGRRSLSETAVPVVQTSREGDSGSTTRSWSPASTTGSSITPMLTWSARTSPSTRPRWRPLTWPSGWPTSSGFAGSSLMR